MPARMDWRRWLLLALPPVSFLALFLAGPIPQDAEYHLFGDQRGWLGIPNFGDVMSNLPFLAVGLMGLRVASSMDREPMQRAWQVLFAGVALVSAGSSWYHLNPDNNTLFWDRLPMTLGFMGLFVALIGEYLSVDLARRILVPAMITGLVSVIWWHYSDDLRLYAWVQFMPLIFIMLLLLLFPSRYSHVHLMWLALAAYLAAKVFETFDIEIFNYLRKTVSGHSIKHLLAASGGYFLWRYLRLRAPLP